MTDIKHHSTFENLIQYSISWNRLLLQSCCECASNAILKSEREHTPKKKRKTKRLDHQKGSERNLIASESEPYYKQDFGR